MAKEILIQIRAGERRVAILNQGKLDDFYIEVDRYQSILGNVYKGRVESILPSINGAFVNIGQERNGFLYLTDAVNPLVEEEEVSGPRRFLNKLLNRKKPSAHSGKKNKKTDSRFQELEKNLSGTLGTLVFVKNSDKGGRIVIKFADLEELNKIAKTILDKTSFF